VPLTINDNQLIAAFNKGEQKAYTVIYDYYRSSVCYFAEQLVGDKVAAEDIAAEAFIKVFKKNTDFDSLDKIKAYLFITANNAALDLLKMQKRHSAVHEKISYLQQEIDLVEENGDQFTAFECKWSETAKVRIPQTFTDNYAGAKSYIVTPSNIEELLSF
jgi:RNA polymerase sigma factor (sigma-70 family)